ncbi:hypothetical protein [Micromonospora sp. NPDC023888]
MHVSRLRTRALAKLRKQFSVTP